MRPGRKPAGPKLVEGVSGSQHAKARVEQILNTLSGNTTIEEACNALNISRSRFCELRRTLLEDMVANAEPRPAGRRPEPKEPEEMAALKKQVERLRAELELTQIRAELNAFVPLQRRKKNDR